MDGFEGRMSSEPRDLSIVLPPPTRGGKSAKLRILKSVAARDSGSYVVIMPGIGPPGLHISLHPSGEIHLRARDTGSLARADLARLRKAVADGTLDAIFSRLLSTPKARRSLSGVILPAELTAKFGEGQATTEIPMQEFLRSMKLVKLGDTRHLPKTLDWMRRSGHLRYRDTILLALDKPGGTLAFVDLQQGAPLDLPPVTIPAGIPFRRTLTATLAQLRDFGGIFVRFPEGKELDRIAEKVGLGGLTKALSRLHDAAKEAGWQTQMEKRLAEVEQALRLVAREFAPPRAIRVTTRKHKRTLSMSGGQRT